MGDSTTPSADAIPPPPSWPDARRIEAWAGESRVNRIRLVALIVFYARHLLDLYARVPPPRPHYNAWATGIVLAWLAGTLLTHLSLAARRLPPWLPSATILMDLLGVTLLGVAGGGPRVPLVLLYFVIITSAPLRLSLRAVYLATLGSWAGYAALLMYYAWVRVGWTPYYSTSDLRIPRTEEAIWFLALGAAGLMAGQSVRQSRRLAAGYPVSVASPEPEAP